MHLVSECHYWKLALTSPLIRAAEEEVVVVVVVVVGENSERNFKFPSVCVYIERQDAETAEGKHLENLWLS